MRTDWSWNVCNKTSKDTDDGESGGMQSNGTTRNLYMIIIGGSVLALICICCAVFGFGWLCKKNKEMRETVQQIQEMYAPMEDLGDKQAIKRASVSMSRSRRRESKTQGDATTGPETPRNQVLL